MCDIGTALKVGGAMMQAQAQKRDEEAHLARTQSAATASMNSQAEQANLKLEEDNRAAIQEAYDLSLKNRAHEASFLVQAAENGVMGISVNEGFMALKNNSARSSIRHRQEVESRKAAHLAHLDGIRAQAGGRINAAAPTTSTSDILMEGAGIAAQGAHEAGLFDNLKIG